MEAKRPVTDLYRDPDTNVLCMRVSHALDLVVPFVPFRKPREIARLDAADESKPTAAAADESKPAAAAADADDVAPCEDDVKPESSASATKAPAEKEEEDAVVVKQGPSAIELGCRLHDRIESYLRTLALPDFSTMQPYECAEWNNFVDFMQKYVGGPYDNLYAAEKRVYVPEWRIAGTPDAIFTLCDEKTMDKTYMLVDWKRTFRLYPKHRFESFTHSYKRYSYQLGLYARMLEKAEGIKISKMVLVALHPDNITYLAYEVDIKDVAADVDEILRLTREYMNMHYPIPDTVECEECQDKL